VGCKEVSDGIDSEFVGTGQVSLDHYGPSIELIFRYDLSIYDFYGITRLVCTGCIGQRVVLF
jgi:hypothetical protein